MVIVVMGASGAGKSTVGRALADELGWQFIDADAFHTAAAIDQMRQGIGLGDEDRWPWLERIGAAVAAAHRAGRDVVVACSALRQEYRNYLASVTTAVRFVYLEADPGLLAARLARRTGHFAAVDLLQSQLETLEPPAETLTLDASWPVARLVGRIRASLTS
jgi:gluconokinase